MRSGCGELFGGPTRGAGEDVSVIRSLHVRADNAPLPVPAHIPT